MIKAKLESLDFEPALEKGEDFILATFRLPANTRLGAGEYEIQPATEVPPAGQGPRGPTCEGGVYLTADPCPKCGATMDEPCRSDKGTNQNG